MAIQQSTTVAPRIGKAKGGLLHAAVPQPVLAPPKKAKPRKKREKAQAQGDK